MQSMRPHEEKTYDKKIQLFMYKSRLIANKKQCYSNPKTKAETPQYYQKVCFIDKTNELHIKDSLALIRIRVKLLCYLQWIWFIHEQVLCL